MPAEIPRLVLLNLKVLIMISGFRLYGVLVFCFIKLLLLSAVAQSATLTINPSGTSTTGSFTVKVSNVFTYKIYEKSGGAGRWVLWKSGDYYNTGPFSRTKDDGIYYYKLVNYQQNGSQETPITKSITVSIPKPTPGTPVITLASKDNNGSYLVKWSATSNAMTYHWSERSPSGNWSSITETGITQVQRNSRSDGIWTYQVSACNGSTCSPPSAHKSINVAHAPSTPVSLGTPSLNDGDFKLDWSSGGGTISKYIIERKKNSDSYRYYRSVTSSYANINDPNAGTYRFRVKACNSSTGWDSCSGWAYTNNITVAKPTSAPTINMGASSDNGSFSLSWGAISNAISYKLEENVVGSSSWNTIQNSGVRSKSFSGDNAKGSNTYRYRVSACNNVGCSSPSAIDAIDVALKPGMPSNIDTAPTNDGDYRISWVASSGSVSKYIFSYENSGVGNWTSIDRGSNLFVDLNLPAGTYRHKVKACKVVGNNTNCSNEKFSGNTLVAIPAAVPELRVAENDSDGDYNVSWDDLPNTTRYELQQNVNGGLFSTIQNNSSTGEVFSGQSSRRYGYQVNACNNIGCTNFSAPKYINVAKKPSVPPSLNAPKVSNGNTPLSWTAASGDIGYYELVYKRENASQWENGYTGSGLTTTLSSLASGVYDHKVRACINVGGNLACSSYRSSQKTKVVKPVVNSYSYDALGRLVRVEEDASVQTVYCYDPAGNRVLLSASDQGGDCPEPAHPGTPTGLTINTPAPNMYIASWDVSAGSTHYIFKYTAEIGETTMILEGGDTAEITIDKDPHAYPPIYIQACNPFGCGGQASF